MTPIAPVSSGGCSLDCRSNAVYSTPSRGGFYICARTGRRSICLHGAQVMVQHSVSVIIPAFNAECFIRDAIESVLHQTVPAAEVIVINDGSTDRTSEILQTFGNRITVIALAGRGAAAARNAGAAAASGTWLAFLDADDTWLPTKLERQLDVAREPGVAMVYTDRLNIGARDPLPERQSDVQQLYAGDVFLDLLIHGNHITLSSVIIHAVTFHSIGGFAEHLKSAEDWDLWVRIAETNYISVCPEALVRYRFHPGMKSSDPWRMRTARTEVIRRAFSTNRGRNLSLVTRRRILSTTARTNAWDASRRGATWLACYEYARAIAAWPFDSATYRGVLRFLMGRHA